MLASLTRATSADRDRVEAHMRAAFAPNALILGVTPLPMLADYTEIMATHEVYLAERDGQLEGTLIVSIDPDCLYIWGIGTAPALQRSGVGRRMLAAAEERAQAAGRTRIKLRTGEQLAQNVAWYQRHGFTVESVEQLPDRRVVNMVKELG